MTDLPLWEAKFTSATFVCRGGSGHRERAVGELFLSVDGWGLLPPKRGEPSRSS